MIIVAALTIGNRLWIPAACGLIVVALITIWRSYRRRETNRWWALTAAALKLTGLAAIALCLIEPLYSGVRARPGANLFVIAADNSRSLRIAERDQSLRKVMTDEEADWPIRLGQDFDLRRYQFDHSLTSVPNFSELNFEGEATHLAAALTTLAERYRSRPLAGVLLLSDGNFSDAEQLEAVLGDMPPIYPVIWEESAKLLDLSIDSVAVSQSPFEDAPVSVKAEIKVLGVVGKEVTAEILNPAGERVAEQTLTLAAGAESLAFRLQFAAPHRGVDFYRLRIAADENFEQFDTPEKSTEATLANNSRLLTIDRGSREQRVLYITGRPNWEFKFLRRALESDEAVQLTGLVRIAKREPKFKWRGGAVDDTNPLFRGFDGKEEETEQYDQPVFVRIDTRDQEELRDGFPKAAEDLFKFDAIILDDIEAEFFTRDQMSLLEDYVSRRGGSLLMLGGQESFRRGGYARTPLGEMLPVYLDREPDQKPSGRLSLSLSRDGWLQPWVRLRSNEQDEQARLRDMPKFHTLNPLSGIKPGATALAYATDQRGTVFPALVAQQFGRGKTAALAVGDLWRWSLRRETAENDDQARALRQMVRWLIADVPGRVEATVEPTDSRAVTLQVRARDEEFQPLDNAAVKVTVKSSDAEELTLTAEPSLEEPGLFVTSYTPRDPGAYQISAEVIDGEEGKANTTTAGWVDQPDVAEFQAVTWNHDLLENIAEKTGGRVIPADQLERFVRGLSQESAPITEHYTYPLWHQSSVFLFALSCFIGEWGIRRWRGWP